MTRVVVALLCLVLLVISAPVGGQARVSRIGYPAAAASFDVLEQAFVAGLRELGYVEGQNLAIEYRFAEGRSERLPQLARELVRSGPDVIVTGGQSAARAIQGVTTSIPVVVAAMPDPVAAQLATSLARPGGNLTGLSFMSTELDG